MAEKERAMKTRSIPQNSYDEILETNIEGEQKRHDKTGQETFQAL